MSSVINAENLKIGYSSSSILAIVDRMQINKGEIVSIIGESGIGKTTLLRNFAKLLSPIDGKLLIFDSQLKPERGKLGYIPQKLGLITHETVSYTHLTLPTILLV